MAACALDTNLTSLVLNVLELDAHIPKIHHCVFPDVATISVGVSISIPEGSEIVVS
jgi:hypothetical protein